jgi:outer membrane receptor protein involved in Fe transport
LRLTQRIHGANLTSAIETKTHRHLKMNTPRYLAHRLTPMGLFSLLVCLTVGVNHARAQQAPAQTPVQAPVSSDSYAKDEEPVALSPFVINATEDKGYEASSTLSGTRIKTDFKDLPASVSAITKGMMDDLGVYNSGQLLTYTLGTEVSGLGGNYSGSANQAGNYDQDGINRDVSSQVRVRGLALADNTTDYFLTSIPWDGYNTERVEIDRGPNAMLFGTGSPAGIINQMTILADLGRDKTVLTQEDGRFGSERTQLDSNSVLIKDKLAIRVALKYSDDRFEQEEAFIRDKRAFASVVFKPFKYTTLRLDAEQGAQQANKPEWRPPFDNGVTYWYQVGKPAYDPVTGKVTLMAPVTGPVSAENANGTPNSNVITGSAGWGTNNPALVFDNPNQLGTTIYGLTGVSAVTNSGPNNISFMSLPQSANYEQYAHAGQPGSGAYQAQDISNPEIFDFYDHILTGNNNYEGFEFHTATMSLEQLLPSGDGGINFEYNRQYLRSSFDNPFNYSTLGIQMDINTTLLNGAPNPNFGRPMIESDSWSTETYDLREAERVTAFYKLDLTKIGPSWLGKLLGTHTFTGNYSNNSETQTTNGGRDQETGPDWIYLNPAAAANGSPYTIPNNAPRGIQYVAYLGSASTGSAIDPTQLNIQPVSVNVTVPGVNTVPTFFYNKSTGSFQTSAVQILQGTEYDKQLVNLDWTGGSTKTETSSEVIILHSDMLDDTFIPTLGYREDNFKAFNAPGDIVDPTGFSESKAPLPSSPTSTQTVHAFNWGAVAKLPEFVESKLPFGLKPRIFYDKATNFSPTAQRFDIFGNPIAPEQGHTKEYGIMLSAFDDKLSLRLTDYQTSLTGVGNDLRDAIHTVVRDGVGGAWLNIINGVNANNSTAVNAFESWYNSPAAASIISTFDFQLTKDAAGNVTGVTDQSRDGEIIQTESTVSKGYELELTYNPTANWRIAVNGSKESVVTSDADADAFLFLQQLDPILNGAAGQVWVNGQHTTWLQNANTFINTVTNAVYADGEPANPELRKYHAALITNYTFTEGPLKGLGVGGGIRYQGKILLGTGYEHSATGDIPDYSILYWGPSLVNYDGWVSYRMPRISRRVDWDVQLNLTNIGVGKKLIATAAQPDGTIATYRIAEPMTWTVRNTFTF